MIRTASVFTTALIALTAVRMFAAADFEVAGFSPRDSEATWRYAQTFTNQTEKIQAAIDSAFRSGGGTVTLGKGLHLVNGLRLRSRVRLHLKTGAVLQGDRDGRKYDILPHDEVEPFDPDAYPSVKEAPKKSFSAMMKPGSKWNNAIIRIVGARDVSVTGDPGSVIDGANSYNPKGEEGYRGVHGISVSYATNVLFSGYVLRHAGNWAHRIDHSADIRCENVTALGGHDGFHIRHCDRVRVTDCVFHTGDDSIAGYDNVDVEIRRCDLSSACSAFRFGGTRVLIEDCTAWGPCKYVFRGSLPPQAKRDGLWDPETVPGRHSMATFFLYFTSEKCPVRKQPGGIVIRRCRVRNAARLLRYNLGGEIWQKGPGLADLVFEDVTATGLSLPLAANAGKSGEAVPFSLSMRNCTLSFEPGQSVFIEGRNLGNVTLRHVDVRGVSGPAVRSWGGRTTLSAENVTGVDLRVEEASGPFRCPPRP